MTKKHILMILATAVIGGVWLYVNRDWFANDRIQIHTRMVPGQLGMRLQSASAPAGNAVPILFEWDRKLRLTSLKIVPVSAIETNSTRMKSGAWCPIPIPSQPEVLFTASRFPG